MPTKPSEFPSAPGQGRYDWSSLLEGSTPTATDMGRTAPPASAAYDRLASKCRFLS